MKKLKLFRGKKSGKPISVTFLVFPLLFTLTGGNIFSQSIEIGHQGLSVEALVEQAESGNIELKQALRTLHQAERDLEGPLTLDTFRVSLAARYGSATPSGGTAAPEGDALSASGDLSIPIVPQITLGGGVAVPLYDSLAAEEGPGEVSGSVNLTARPFASPKPTARSTESYEKAYYSYIYRKAELLYSVEKVFLSVLTAEKERTDAEKILRLRTKEYEIAKEKYNLGEATLKELTNQADALSEARQSYYSGEKALLSAERDFFTVIGRTSTADTVIRPVTLDDVSERIEKRSGVVQSFRNGPPQSLNLALLRIELESLTAQKGMLRTYRPDLSVTASMDFPSSDFSVGISYSFSPGDIKTDEVATLEENILSMEEKIRNELFTLQKEKEMLLSQTRTAEEILNLNRSAYEDALLTLEEVRFLAEEGDRTRIELLQAELSAQSKRTALYASAVELYTLLGDFILLFTAPLEPTI